MDIPIDISTTKLETERLIMRPWSKADLKDLFEYASVPGVGEMAGWQHHETIKVSKKILKLFMSEKNVFALVFKESGKVIGSLGLHISQANEDPIYKDLKMKEVGYVLSKAYWGKGLMTEAVHEVMRFCFETLKLDALTAGHFLTNGRSRRVIEKCGFRPVKKSSFYAKQLDKTFEDIKYIIRNPDHM